MTLARTHTYKKQIESELGYEPYLLVRRRPHLGLLRLVLRSGHHDSLLLILLLSARALDGIDHLVRCNHLLLPHLRLELQLPHRLAALRRRLAGRPSVASHCAQTGGQGLLHRLQPLPPPSADQIPGPHPLQGSLLLLADPLTRLARLQPPPRRTLNLRRAPRFLGSRASDRPLRCACHWRSVQDARLDASLQLRAGRLNIDLGVACSLIRRILGDLCDWLIACCYKFDFAFN